MRWSLFQVTRCGNARETISGATFRVADEDREADQASSSLLSYCSMSFFGLQSSTMPMEGGGAW